MNETRRALFVIASIALISLWLGAAFADTPDADWLNRAVGKCADCHFEKGVMHTATTPMINGQKKTYLEKQLLTFRNIIPEGLDQFQLSTRNAHIMDFTSSALSDEDVEAIASYFSRLKCDAVPNKSASYVQDIPCARCHGKRGISDKEDVPNLAGQSKEYMIIQLKALKKGTLDKNRNFYKRSSLVSDPEVARYHRYMGRWANKIDGDDISLVADYYASLPCR